MIRPQRFGLHHRDGLAGHQDRREEVEAEALLPERLVDIEEIGRGGTARRC